MEASTAHVFDVDIGKDPDDTCVAAMVALQPERFRPTLWLTNDEAATRGRARFLAHLLRESGRELPVASGLPSLRRCEDTLVERAGLVPASGGDFIEDGVGCLVDVLSRHDRTRYFGLGALTNLAEALRRRPDLAPRVELVQMGPALASGHTRGTAQYNARIDPAAFSAVLQAVTRPTLVMSHASWGAYAEGGRQRLGLYPDDPVARELGRSEHPAHRLLARHLATWVETGKPCSVMHDPLTVLSQWEDALVDWAEVDVVLGSEGYADLTPASWEAPPFRSLVTRRTSVLEGPTVSARIAVRTHAEAVRRAIVQALFPERAGSDALAEEWRAFNASRPE